MPLVHIISRTNLVFPLLYKTILGKSLLKNKDIPSVDEYAPVFSNTNTSPIAVEMPFVKIMLHNPFIHQLPSSYVFATFWS